MSGPTHSNRNYKVMIGYSLPEDDDLEIPAFLRRQKN